MPRAARVPGRSVVNRSHGGASRTPAARPVSATSVGLVSVIVPVCASSGRSERLAGDGLARMASSVTLSCAARFVSPGWPAAKVIRPASCGSGLNVRRNSPERFVKALSVRM